MMLENSPSLENCAIILLGGVDEISRDGAIIRLPHHSGIYHPDLVYASDALVGKLGYSTLAEVYAANVRFGYIPRRRFRESPPLAKFVEREMAGMSIDDEEFEFEQGGDFF